MNEKKGKKILFSCVGRTDPYKDNFDGPICHILRNNLDLKKVYLFFSSEIIKGEIYNHRYTRAIKAIIPDIEIEIYPKTEKIQEYLDMDYTKIDEEKAKEIEEYVKKEPKLIENPQQYDIYYKEFYNILTDIRNDEEDGAFTILFNIASGTPSMKSAIYLINSLEAQKTTKGISSLKTELVYIRAPRIMRTKNPDEFKYIPYSLPENLEDYKNENVEENLSNSPDSDLSGENRYDCIMNDKTTQLIVYNNVKEMFEKCDYYGVSELVQKYNSILSDKLVLYAEHLGLRITGEVDKAEKVANSINKLEKDAHLKLYPIRSKSDRMIVEKFNNMKVKNIRDEINDWLLITTPLEVSIYIKLLENKGVLISDYTNAKSTSSKRPRWDIKKLKENKNKIYEGLKKKVIDIDASQGKDISGFVLQKIIETVYISKEEETIINNIKYLEKSRIYRNAAAHQVIYVTRDEVKNNGIDIEKLEKSFEFLISKIYKNKDEVKKALNIYTTIENCIINEFEQEIRM